ncbi:family 43 glycosylhydrolase [Labilibaculum filiforme]|nr:family 43 glycosylhydrolase [Labilibaculum filiforme]
MNRYFTFLSAIALFLTFTSWAQNPIVPAGMYIADPEAHVWQDGKIYVYGSRDESDDFWCSYKHHVLFSDNLQDWNVIENSFASKGEFDQVDYHDQLLFAPDCAYKNGTYYLYYCSPKTLCEGVARSKSPLGPFSAGKEIIGANQIDPAVLVDDDGQAYYYWGQGKPKVAKLKANMTEIDSSTITLPLDEAGNKAFHEGSSIRKIGDWYYFVCADDSRENRPTCLGYATSKNPMGPFEYKGVIIDNIGCDPAVWNNHGSIEKFKDQWYVFYHRSTHNSQKFRKACIEPIKINKDGTIDEVEMTTQGAGKALAAGDLMQAERACLLSGKVFIDESKSNDIPNEELTNIAEGDYAVYKYLNFEKQLKNFRIKTNVSNNGLVELRLDEPDGTLIGSCNLSKTMNKTAFQISNCEIESVKGKHALYLVFKGENNSFFTIDWFQFY